MERRSFFTALAAGVAGLFVGKGLKLGKARRKPIDWFWLGVRPSKPVRPSQVTVYYKREIETRLDFKTKGHVWTKQYWATPGEASRIQAFKRNYRQTFRQRPGMLAFDEWQRRMADQS